MSADPRVTIQPVETREEALALAEDLAHFPHGIHSMRIAAESAEGRVAVGYIVRSTSAEILGWGHARLMGDAAELSWETHPSHRGHGYMREAAPHFVEALVRRPDVKQAYAWIPPENTASQEVARACGMTLTDAPGPSGLWVRQVEPRSSDR